MSEREAVYHDAAFNRYGTPSEMMRAIDELGAENEAMRARCDALRHEDAMRREIEALTKERDELRAIVERLPKTADGVAVTFDMPIYNKGESGKIHEGGVCWYSDCPCGCGDIVLPSDLGVCWYSTRASAEAARKGKG